MNAEPKTDREHEARTNAAHGSDAGAEKLVKCPRCRGKGKWQNANCTAMDDDVICPDCKGRGYRPEGVNGEGI